jgi:hypothetical protein
VKEAEAGLASVNGQFDMAMHKAASNGHLDVVKFLLEECNCVSVYFSFCLLAFVPSFVCLAKPNKTNKTKQSKTNQSLSLHRQCIAKYLDFLSFR